MAWAVPLLTAVTGAMSGARVLAPEARTGRALAVGCVIGAVLGALALAFERGSGVSDADYIKGVALAAAALGPVPFLLYFGLGRMLAGRRWILTGAVLVSLIALAYYTFIAFIATYSLVYCGPGAYECPV